MRLGHARRAHHTSEQIMIGVTRTSPCAVGRSVGRSVENFNVRPPAARTTSPWQRDMARAVRVYEALRYAAVLDFLMQYYLGRRHSAGEHIQNPADWRQGRRRCMDTLLTSVIYVIAVAELIRRAAPFAVRRRVYVN